MMNIILENPKSVSISTAVPFEHTQMDVSQATRAIEKALLKANIVCDEIKILVRI